MEVDRLGVKFFAHQPAGVGDIRSLVPVFHSWIQRQAIPNHVLIDVHDYSHIHHGPGILLVAHEGNFSFDLQDGRPGLLYSRKQPAADSVKDRIAVIVSTALQACEQLERELPIRFRTDELQIVSNDRLNAPNDVETFSRLSPMIASALATVFSDVTFSLAHVSATPRARLAISVRDPLSVPPAQRH